MPHFAPILAQIAFDPPVWTVAGLIVILGLFVYGLRDVLKLSLGRIWAISGVCFRDAIRRRVLWVTPLAMLGVIIVVQLQKPFDEQDAIRLTVKFCFFATALVVTIVSVITAATNLPREIDNRVIYTIVTKPVTRLEIVAGKILGFSRVSAAILLMMGIFTLGYLHLRAWSLGRQIAQTLQNQQVDATSREWLSHFSQSGLLVSKHLSVPVALNQYARLPTDGRGWVQAGGQNVLARFPVTPETPIAGLGFHIAWERVANAPADAPPPAVTFQFYDPRDMSNLIGGAELGVNVVPLKDPAGKETIVVPLPPEKMAELVKLPFIVLGVTPVQAGTLYGFDKDSLGLMVAGADGQIALQTSDDPVQFRGSSGRSGQQLQGPEENQSPVAIFHFRDVTPTVRDGQVPFEMYAGIERSGDESEAETPTVVEIAVRDAKTGQLGPATWVYPENNRTSFFTLPADQVPSGNFDLVMRNRTQSHVIGLGPEVVSMVTGREYFGFNVLKGLLVLWLFSILVSTIAFCCSTFLSWPIAVVLTLLALVVRWGVSNFEIGTSSGIGGQVAQEVAGSNASTALVVNNTVEGLIRVLTTFARATPDIAPFGVTEQVERGLAITAGQLASPAFIVLLFALPLATLAYVFLRNKEVAP